MNKFIKQQLDKTKECIIPPYSENDTEIFIPKKTIEDKPEGMIIGHFYRIKIADYIINEPDNFTLSSNWNHGTKPKENILNIELQKIMGKMIYVNSTTYYSGEMWEGWLPSKAVTVLEEI